MIFTPDNPALIPVLESLGEYIRDTATVSINDSNGEFITEHPPCKNPSLMSQGKSGLVIIIPIMFGGYWTQEVGVQKGIVAYETHVVHTACTANVFRNVTTA